MVQLHHDEGVANHFGPEPCTDIREGVGEASAGYLQASHGADTKLVLAADAVCVAEGQDV
jgi:hypothetical protein